MSMEASPKGQRVVLAQRTPDAMVELQWTGNEPVGLNDVRQALVLGAIWEGDELVTYNYRQFSHSYQHWVDEFLEDDD